MLNLFLFILGLVVASCGVWVAAVSHDKAKDILALSIGALALICSVSQIGEVAKWLSSL